MDTDALARLSAEQYGVFSRTQLLGLGASEGYIRHQLSSGRWRVELPSVYGLVGHRQSWRRRLWAAHLHAGPDSVIAMCSAGRIHGAEQVPVGMVDLIVSIDRARPPAGVRWYRRIDLEPSDVVRIPGLPPVTSPARTAVDLAAMLHVARLRLMVESGAAQGRYTLGEVGALLDRVRRSGKRGVRRLATVLDDLGPGDGIARTELERLGDGVLAAAGLPAPTHEHPLPNERGRTGFVDRCWTDAKLIVEFDGRKWHHRFQQALQDADRTLEARVLGWETLRLLWEHCSSDGERTARQLATIYADRRSLLAAERASNP
jgi:hypothetical protein